MAAHSDAPVLIQGETGTGKSMSARAIHKLSSRGDGPFVALNCGSLPLTLLESELFGYEPGSFTGALKKGRRGVFETAHGGTLFLDEIAELPAEAQATLLHVLDGEPFRRVGGTADICVDVRILAATNTRLEERVAQGSFRKDLFYRLRVIAVDIPPVRERQGDVLELMERFLAAAAGSQPVPHLSTALRTGLQAYQWPGNIREIRSTARCLLALGRKRLTLEDLPSYILSALPEADGAAGAGRPGLQEELEALEKELIARALRETGSSYKAARLLKVSQSTVVRRARRYGLTGLTAS